MNKVIFSVTDEYGDNLSIETGNTYPENLYVEINDSDEAQIELLPDDVKRLGSAIDEFLADEEVVYFTDDPNEAKLRLAVHFDLRVKFAYTGDRDYRAVERRLEPTEVYEGVGGLYVRGDSYDEGGAYQGVRQFRLDRISGSVVVR